MHVSPYLTFVNRDSDHSRNVFVYIESRYHLPITTRRHSMYDPLHIIRRGQEWVRDGSDIIVCLKKLTCTDASRQFLMLLTRSFNVCRSANVIFINKYSGSVFYSSGASCSSEYFHDTLVEGYFETPDVFSLSDILIHKGAPLFRIEQEKRGVFSMDSVSRASLMQTLAEDFEKMQSPIKFTVPTWHSSVECLYRSIFSTEKVPALPMHMVVRRNVNKYITQKDVFVKIGADPVTEAEQETETDDPVPMEKAVEEAVKEAVEEVVTNAFEEVATEYKEVEDETGDRMFFVRATNLPDVYELYDHFASIGLIPPDAIAGILTLRDSHAMTQLFKHHKGCRTVLRHTFSFNSTVRKWVPIFMSGS